MRKPIRASMIAAFSLLLGTLALGCGEPGTPTGQGGSGGSGGGGGAGGLGGSGQGGTGGSTGCTEEATQPCYTGAAGTQGVGLCKAGTQTCVNHQWGACMGEVLPVPEACNSSDDDCNGQIDENFPAVTCGKGACQVMVDGCLDGMVPACNPGEPATETCDGTDEDCNGEIDNGINCPCTTEGEMRSCYSGGMGTAGVGTCKTGTQTCVGGAWGPCENEVLPTMETCDGLDNDCDATNDENIPKQTCGFGACNVTVDGCVDGAPPVCMPGQPKAETCNGIDDDCNGFMDDGFDPITCGVGACEVTVQACSAGVPQTCVPKMPAANEICDGIDNNCNGTTDEGNPGGGVNCSTMLPGVCNAGTLNCTNGALSCVQNQMAAPESCDGKDNDCDGMSDEGNPGGNQNCMTGGIGACALGKTQCVGGMITCPATTMGTPETCDGVDNDCDGATDEGLNGAACTVPGKFGICAAGTVQCQNGSIICQQVNMPAPTESCNGLDDNCNNTTDEGNPGGGGACTVPNRVGPCANGTFNCTMGNLTCTQTVFPATEVCGDSIDQDCNGSDNACCPHSVCQTGGPMQSGCGSNSCTTNVCTYNNGAWSYCCTNTWDAACTLVPDFACGAGSCCAHTVCGTGGPLVPTCSACAAAICAAKPACCTTGWTEACVDRVNTYCGGANSTYCGSCPHSVCTVGVGLTSGCNSCVTAVCAAMPSCCGAGGSWTSACVNLVATQCNSTFSCN